jgi:hypothetical protein
MQAPIIPYWLSITETIVKILAVVFAGGWAIFLLIALKQVATARIQLDKLQADRNKTLLETEKTRYEINKTALETEKIQCDINKAALDTQKAQREIQELELKLKAQPVIQASIVTATQRTSPENEWLLFATVNIKNVGNAPARLAYDDDDPFRITEVDFDPEGKPVYKQSMTLPLAQARDPNAPALATIIRAGGEETLPFVLHLKRPGLYLLGFRANTGSDDRETLKGLRIPEWRPVSWTAKRYVWIEEVSEGVS